MFSFGAYAPEDQGLFAHEKIRVALARATRVHRKTLVEYDESCGTSALREAVARRALHLGCHLKPDDIIITASCTHAVGLCLQAVTRPGDVVALESPTHFGFLDLLEALELRVLEIPTHPTGGMSLPALQLAIDTQPVKVVLSVPTLSNPLGAVMRHSDKLALVKILAARQIPLIEDVVFNDLLASDRRRKAAKAFDGDGWVMICGSFCKTIAPGLRMGYVEAGRWKDTVSRLKRVQGVPTIKVLEYALAELLTQSGYEARLRRLSAMAKTRLNQARTLIFNNFPKVTRVSAPQGGYTLWVELPPQLNAMALFRECKVEGIIFSPGALFSASNHFDHCMRLSFAGPWTDVQQRALARIGNLARAQRNTDKETKA
jgi:DNA-binding transcriptional MocR family regulator